MIEEPQRPAMFAEEVDSVVVEPFRFVPGLATQLNEVDQKLFADLLTEELLKRPFLRVFPEAPTDLPTTLILAGEVTGFEIRELPGKEVFLREIHIDVELQTRIGGSLGSATPIRRQYSFQKVYLPAETIPVSSFDLRDAVAEVAEILAEVMYPVAISGGLPLADGTDPNNGLRMGHDLLLRGNRYAANHRYERARNIWRYVLFEPVPEEKGEEAPEELFRISRRALVKLREKGMDEDTVAQLESLTAREAEELVEFRAQVRDALGGFTRAEADILNAADHAGDQLHLNLAAAHRNLAVLYWLESRYDRAAYHLGRAYANFPEDESLAKWAKIQSARGLLPDTLDEEEAIALFLRLPPPRGMALEPGSRENSLFTPVVFEEVPAPAGESGGAAAQEAEGGDGQVELKPVERPPVEETPPSNQPGLPPIQAAERADAN